MTDDTRRRALEAVAARAAAASHLEPPGGEALLRSVVEAAVVVFGAQATSIALHEPDTDRLVIRAAAGPQGRERRARALVAPVDRAPRCPVPAAARRRR